MSGPAQIDAKEAARVAEQVEQELKQVGQEQGEAQAEQREADTSAPGPGQTDSTLDDTLALVESWKVRLSDLEEKVSASKTAPPPNMEDFNELQSVAEGVAKYRQQLMEDCGYRKKDLKEDPDLPELEARLDKLSEKILPGNDSISTEKEEEGLLAWAEQQTDKLAEITHQTSNISPSERKEIQQIVKEVVELKGKMAVEGLTQHEQDKHDEMQRRMWRLRDLRQKDHRDKKHDGRQQTEAKQLKEEADKLHQQIEEHKKRLMAEKGYSADEAKGDSVVKDLEQRYHAICQIAGA